MSGSTYMIDFLSKPNSKHVAILKHEMQILFACNHTFIDFSLFIALSLYSGRKQRHLEGTHMCTHHRENTQTPPSPICTMFSCAKQKLSDQMSNSDRSLFMFYLFSSLSYPTLQCSYVSTLTSHGIEYLSVLFFLFCLLNPSNCALLSILVHS